MLIWIYLSLIMVFRPIYANNCRSLFLAYNTILPQRSYAPYTNDSCWDQCYTAREDFALILNNRGHLQYEWCSPGEHAGLCIIDQGIVVVQDTCNCTVIVRYPRILKDSEQDKLGKSCKLEEIQKRLSLPKRGKYTDFPITWRPMQILMKRPTKGKYATYPPFVDYYESGHNVECKTSKGEHCGWRGECDKDHGGNDKHSCEHSRDPELNLIDTVPEKVFFRSTKSMEFLQLDTNNDYLPDIPYL